MKKERTGHLLRELGSERNQCGAGGGRGEGGERWCAQRVNIVTREQTVKHNI